MSSIKKLYHNKYFYLSASLIIAQQIIVASSSVWLKNLSNSLMSTNSQEMILNLTLYVGSLILPYIPGATAIVLCVYWREALIQKLSAQFVQSHIGRIDVWNSRKIKEEKTLQMSNILPNSLTDFTNYSIDTLSTSLNVFLNAFVLITLVELNYVWGFGLSLISLVFLSLFQLSKQEKIEKMAYDSRLILGTHWNSAWDNVLINNKISFSKWIALLDIKQSKRQEAHLKTEKNRQLFSVLACLVAFIPVFSIAIISIFKNLNHSTYVLSIVLTIPRLFMIMNGLHSLINLVFEWPGHKTKIQEVLFHVGSPKEENLRIRIKYDGLNIFSHKSYGNIQHLELVESLKKMSVGRFTIQGENGTGKSTFLQTLKNEFKTAVYIPPYNSLMDDQEISSQITCDDMSTGQKQFKNITNFLKQQNPTEEYRIFLLDEWDSNLDQEKIQIISEQINLLAATNLIVEIRHKLL